MNIDKLKQTEKPVNTQEGFGSLMNIDKLKPEGSKLQTRSFGSLLNIDKLKPAHIRVDRPVRFGSLMNIDKLKQIAKLIIMRAVLAL